MQDHYSVSNKPQETTEELKKVLDVNVVGQVHLFSIFMPQILKGKVKKVITLTSGLADLDFTNQFDVFTGSLYAISKAAANMAIAKFSAQYKEDGVLFISVAPGLVDTGLYNTCKCHTRRVAI
jgi:NAD(P)-dependent dehydrogenase (short-subunit alcohol dehydrogenase family)